MGRALSKREIGLGGALLAAGIGYLWLKSGRVAEGPAAEAAARAKAASATMLAPKVRTDLLATNAVQYDARGRDLFQYAVRPPSAEEIHQMELERKRQQEQAALEAQQRIAAAAQQAAASQARVVELQKNPPKPQPPQITLKYTGYVGPKNDKVAVFDDGDEQLVAKKGEVLKGQFRVIEIKGETVVMGYTNPAFKDVTRELSLSPTPR